MIVPYVIARKMNNKEYYMENIDHENNATWITNKYAALSFEHPGKLAEFIKREFPNKDYYISRIY